MLITSLLISPEQKGIGREFWFPLSAGDQSGLSNSKDSNYFLFPTKRLRIPPRL